MPPTYYRGCWHVVSRGFLLGYRHYSSPSIEVYNPKAFILHAASLHQASAHCAIFPTAASRRSLGRVSVPMWPFVLSDRLLIVALVSRYPTNWLISRGPLLHQITLFLKPPCGNSSLRGISDDFSPLSPCEGQVIHVLLTRSPLSKPRTQNLLSPVSYESATRVLPSLFASDFKTGRNISLWSGDIRFISHDCPYTAFGHPADSRFLTLTVRLACVKHAASVHPEPGSNSHVCILHCSKSMPVFLFCHFLFYQIMASRFRNYYWNWLVFLSWPALPRLFLMSARQFLCQVSFPAFLFPLFIQFSMCVLFLFLLTFSFPFR